MHQLGVQNSPPTIQVIVELNHFIGNHLPVSSRNGNEEGFERSLDL